MSLLQKIINQELTPAPLRKLLNRKSFQITALAVVFISSIVLFFLARSYLDLERLLVYGYSGIFLVNLISSATVLVPLPGEIVNIAAGNTFNPLTIGLIAGSGSAIGELTSYYAGYMGRDIILSRKYLDKYQHAISWLTRNANLAVFIFALSPFFVFDLMGIAAGVFRFSLWKFFLFCWLGRLLRCIIEAYLGYGTFSFLPSF